MENNNSSLSLPQPHFLGLHEQGSDHASILSDLTLVNSTQELHPVTSHFDVEEPKTRSKFRLIAILVALYVSVMDQFFPPF